MLKENYARLTNMTNKSTVDLPYTAEIESMDPICLHGDLNNISKL